ncbi:DEAD/DEAH box helicase [Rhizosaccharibacter radicis]|uniref:DEAD/DEAH box helicase n=1 Tax=Rhizosaccharibacter radicis TaxID=2782605 RepID=A0ABT1VZ48_9PROT|nr:DEAD/DEAH box helicase [Acetobacteraceae bacterium KSS12]
MPFPQTHPALARALAAKGYEEPTPVQAAVAEPETAGRDLLVSAQTGSGKTVAYGLAAAGTLLGDAERLGRATRPLALVIAPTRELALQVQRELEWLYAEAGARVVSCIGGMDVRREARSLEGGCHIVVGTPGRLCDHLSRNRLDLSALRVVVLDEADEMLDLGFKDELDQILEACPAERRTLLFSATIAREIVAMARRYQRDALRIDISGGGRQHSDIEYRAVLVAPQDGEHALVNVLRWFESPTAMVFCSTREMVRHVHGSLMERGFASVALSGELSQNERSRALEALRSGQARVCVATDVAARGIDLPDLQLVVHAGLPTDPATLLHRSGRTGRAGRKGTCVMLVPLLRRRAAERLLMGAKVQAAWEVAPSPDAIRARDGERLLADPVLAEEAAPEDAALIEQLCENRDAAALAAALLRFHRQRLPDPEELRPVSLPSERPVREPRPRAEHAVRDGGDVPQAMDGAWFAMPVGRRDKADPKWLVPLICRLGGVKKRDIGLIRIADAETRFEIAPAMADRFRACIEATDTDEVRIEPSSAPAGGAGPGPRRSPPPSRRPNGDRPYNERPQGERSQGDRPQGERPFRRNTEKRGAGSSRKRHSA